MIGEIEDNDDISVSNYGKVGRSGVVESNSSGRSSGSSQAPAVVKKVNARTIYSDLPADASTFTYSGELVVDNGVTPIVTAQYLLFEQVVPDGYVLYVKSFRAFIQNVSSKLNPLLTGVPNVNILVSLANNNNVSPFNQDILVEPLGGFNPCYLIAGQNAKVQVSVRVDFTSLPIRPTDINFLTLIRGNALARNNMPPSYTALIAEDLGNG